MKNQQRTFIQSTKIIFNFMPLCHICACTLYIHTYIQLHTYITQNTHIIPLRISQKHLSISDYAANLNKCAQRKNSITNLAYQNLLNRVKGKSTCHERRVLTLGPSTEKGRPIISTQSPEYSDHRTICLIIELDRCYI